MSDNDNKKIVDRAKKILKDLGYDVKTGHLYQLLSNLAGFNNWNVAKTKNVDFKKVVETINREQSKIDSEKSVDLFPSSYNLSLNEKHNNYLSKFLSVLGNPENYELNKKVKNQVFLGFFEEESKRPSIFSILKDKSLKFSNFEFYPNSIFIGDDRKEVTLAVVSTILSTLVLNSENSQIFIVNTNSSIREYDPFIQKGKDNSPMYPQICHIDQINKFEQLLIMLCDELKARRTVSNLTGYKIVSEFENNLKINRIYVVMEDCDRLMSEINFKENFQKEGTLANRLWLLMRVGRAAGIWFIAASSKRDIQTSPEVIRNFLNKILFKISEKDSLYFFGTTTASLITEQEKGRYLTDYGFGYQPLITNPETIKELLKHVKPLVGQSFYLTLEKINQLR